MDTCDPHKEASLEPDATAPQGAGRALSSRTELKLEIGVVIIVGAFPYFVNALTTWDGHPRENAAHWSRFAAGAAISLQISAALLWIMYRSRRSWREFGIVRILPGADVLLSLCVAGLIWGTHQAMHYVLWFIETIVPSASHIVNIVPRGSPRIGPASPHDAYAVIGLVVWNFLNGFGEELVLRSYLVPRIRTLTGSAFLAVIASAATGASYHIYQGSYSTIVIFFGQAAMATLFLKVRRLWPFAIGHALYDLGVRYLYYS